MSSRSRRVGLLEGTEPGLSTETRGLLRTRLLAFVVVAAAAMGLFLARDALGLAPLVDGPRHVASLAALFLGLGGLAVLLSSKTSLGLRQLRAIEIVVVGFQAAWMASNQYAHLALWVRQGNEALVVGQVDSAAFPYFATMVAYGVLIPNTWSRALRVAGLLALTPFIVFAVFPLTVTEGSAGIHLSIGDYATLTIELLIAVIIALACTHTIHTLRTESFDARQLGQYRLTERIGAGGMGDVWKAEHHFLARPAAIKQIHPEMIGARNTAAAQNILRRFEREAQATASLSSVHTVEIFDFGISHDGAFFYVMELLDGYDLETLVRQFGPLPAARVVYLLRQACESLAEAHEKGLVHRDIKPSNIYACRMGQRCDFVKVLDFGLVIGEQGGQDTETRLTKEGTILGTPAYMSPESIFGGAGVDGRSDTYALGCVGYWLLTGGLVFDAANPMAMALAHARDDPPPPSTRTELVIPSSLEATILACLHKAPSDRPDADDLARRLITCQVDAWTQTDSREWWDLHILTTREAAGGDSTEPLH